MEKITTKHLVTINLKYGSSAKPLKVLAFAQLSAKALFLSGGASDIDGLVKRIADLIGVKKVSKKYIGEGLEYLRDIKKVDVKEKKWFLTEKAKKGIKKDVESSQHYLDGVLERHFPTTIKKSRIKNWFNEASAEFFGYYSKEWIIAVCKKTTKKLLKAKSADELLNTSIEKNKLSQHKQQLVDGFISFLSSSDIADHQYLMSLGQAMFSAHLVAADVGVDPLTLEELKDSKFILDTNLLMAVTLENHRASKSFKALGAALKTIGGELVYLHTTKEEYDRALTGKRGEILHLIDNYPDEVIKGVRDDFIHTAKSRGCVKKEDYIRFFDSLRELPSQLPDGPNISIEDYKEIEETVQKAEKDIRLKQEIQNYNLKLRPPWRKKEKSRLALNHDAALIHVCELIRGQDEKCWILSLDRTLQACVLKRTGPHSMPSILSIDALIEIMAVNSAGPELDSSDFAPLLAKIILNNCIPPANTYTTEDLNWLLTINERAADLPSEKIKEIVKEITKARMAGKQIGDSKLELKVNRMFQGDKIDFNQKMADARTRVEQAKEEAHKEKVLRQEREEQIIKMSQKELIRNEKWKLAKGLIFRIITTLVCTAVLYFIFGLIPRINQFDYLLAAVTSFLSLALWVPKPYQNYKEALKKVPKRAKTKLGAENVR